MKAPLVSVCIPAYKSGAGLTWAIESALAQTVSDIEIVVSNDGGYPVAALDVFRGHPNVRVFDQPRRLGWVENSNFVLSQAVGQYFMILPHDDQIFPSYLEACLSVLESERQAFAAHSDVQTTKSAFQIREIRGDLHARIEDVFQNHLFGTSFHALMRRPVEGFEVLRLQSNPPSDFLVDTVWILQQALLGEIRRVPEPLFFKYLGAETTHAGWQNLAPAEIVRGWLGHCDMMEEIALRRCPDFAKIRELAARRRDPNTVADSRDYMKRAFAAVA